MQESRPNQPCLCGSTLKYKKCCLGFIEGADIVHPERLIQTRYVAAATANIKFLWDTLHPQAALKLRNRWRMFESENQVLKQLDFRKLMILDERIERDDKAVFVQYITVYEGEEEVSYIEESELKKFENKWLYFDGLRRSSSRIGCVPESVRIGDLRVLYLQDSERN